MTAAVAPPIPVGKSPRTPYTPSEKARRAIVSVLGDFPNITKSMISVHVQPIDRAWGHTLTALIDEGIVTRDTKFRNGGTRATVVYRLTNPN